MPTRGDVGVLHGVGKAEAAPGRPGVGGYLPRYGINSPSLWWNEGELF
jgi:hypothetical protein